MEWKQASPLEGQEILEQALGQLSEESETQAVEEGRRQEAISSIAMALGVPPEELTDMQREFVEAFLQKKSAPIGTILVDFGVEGRKPEVK
jgi:hypothetical protein